MKFPKIGDIATREIVAVDIHDTLAYAIDKMTQSNHKNIILKREDEFSILMESYKNVF